MLKATALTYRNAYSGLSRSTWLLSLIMLINRSGTMVIPFMTLYLTSSKVGFTIGQAGFIFGLFGAGAFSGAFLGGKLTDKIGFYPVQMMALIGGGILFIVLGQMHTYSLICFFTFLVGFVNEAFRPANTTAIAHYSSEQNRTRSYALNRLAINVGWAIGMGIGGIIAKFSYELLFWVDGFTNIGAALLMWIAIKPIKVDKEKKSDEQKVIAPTKSAYRDKTYIRFVIITCAFACCFFQIFTNMPVYFKTVYHLSEPYIGFIMSASGLMIALFEMVIVYKVEGKRHMLDFITIGTFLGGIGFFLLVIPKWGLLIATTTVFIATVGEMISMPFMNSYWIARTAPHNRGQYAAMYTMAWAAAQTIGPIIGSQVAFHFGFTTLWIGVGLIFVLTAGAYRTLKK